MSGKTASLESEISLGQQMLTKLTKEMEEKKQLVDSYYMDAKAKNSEIKEEKDKSAKASRVVTDTETNLRKKMNNEINPMLLRIEKAESTTKEKGVEEIKIFYNELEDQTFEEFLQGASA